MRIALAVTALLALSACEREPEPAPAPVKREAPPRALYNYEKGIARMKAMAPTPVETKRARRAMPGLIAMAETRTLRNPDSTATCAAWDAVAANAMRQNDPALVHLWGTLADRRCEGSGRETRYWAEP